MDGRRTDGWTRAPIKIISLLFSNLRSPHKRTLIKRRFIFKTYKQAERELTDSGYVNVQRFTTTFTSIYVIVAHNAYTSIKCIFPLLLFHKAIPWTDVSYTETDWLFTNQASFQFSYWYWWRVLVRCRRDNEKPWPCQFPDSSHPSATQNWDDLIDAWQIRSFIWTPWAELMNEYDQKISVHPVSPSVRPKEVRPNQWAYI